MDNLQLTVIQECKFGFLEVEIKVFLYSENLIFFQLFSYFPDSNALQWQSTQDTCWLKYRCHFLFISDSSVKVQEG